MNQSLVDELNEEKNKNNRLEYEIESLKIDADKPIRENRQLRKDLEDILKKINEKQEMYFDLSNLNKMYSAGQVY